MNKQRGIAIIVAVLVVALAASAAAFAAWQQGIWIRQTQNRLHQSQASAVARAALDFGRAVLAQDMKGNGAATDNLDEDWAKYALAVPVEGGSVKGRLVDAQSFFNLNNLVINGQPSPVQIATFQALLTGLKLSPDLAAAVTDWIDPDDTVTFPGGAEDLDYLGKPEPYRTAGQPMVDVEELRYIKGFDDEIIAKLKPFIIVLPVTNGPTPLNINTAPKEVLSALFGSTSTAESLISMREKPFKDQQDLQTRAAALLPQPPENNPRNGNTPGGGTPDENSPNGNPPPGNTPPPGGATPTPPGSGTGPGGTPGPNPPNPNAPNPSGGSAPTPQLGQDYDIRSNYFVVLSQGQFGEVTQGVVAVVGRASGGPGWPAVLSQQQTIGGGVASTSESGSSSSTSSTSSSSSTSTGSNAASEN